MSTICLRLVLAAVLSALVLGAPQPAGGRDRWHPDPEALAAAAAGPSGYDGAPGWDGGSHCSGGLTEGASDLAAAIRAHFGPHVIGGYSCRPNTAATGQTSVHGVGRALDVMTDAGEPIANWLLLNSARLGVQMIIWDRSLWRAGASDARAYGGPNPHTDHVHVEVRSGGGIRRAILVT